MDNLTQDLIAALRQIKQIEGRLYNMPDDVRERAAMYAGALGDIRLVCADALTKAALHPHEGEKSINAQFDRILKGE